MVKPVRLVLSSLCFCRYLGCLWLGIALDLTCFELIIMGECHSFGRVFVGCTGGRGDEADNDTVRSVGLPSGVYGRGVMNKYGGKSMSSLDNLDDVSMHDLSFTSGSGAVTQL